MERARGRLSHLQNRQRRLREKIQQAHARHPWLAGFDLYRGRAPGGSEDVVEMLKAFPEEYRSLTQEIAAAREDIRKLESDVEEEAGRASEVERAAESARGRLGLGGEDGGMSDEQRGELIALLERVESKLNRWKRQGLLPRILLGDIENLRGDYSVDELQLNAMRQNLDQTIGRSLLGDYLQKREEALASSMCENARGCLDTGGADAGNRASLQGSVAEILNAMSRKMQRPADNGSPQNNGAVDGEPSPRSRRGL